MMPMSGDDDKEDDKKHRASHLMMMMRSFVFGVVDVERIRRRLEHFASQREAQVNHDGGYGEVVEEVGAAVGGAPHLGVLNERFDGLGDVSRHFVAHRQIG